MIEEFTFTLEKPIKSHVKIDGKNEIMDLTEIFLIAPADIHKFQCMRIKKSFMEAISAMTQTLSREQAEKQANNDSEETMDAKAVLAILYMAKDFDIASFFQKFNEFLATGVAFKDEEKKQRILLQEVNKLSESDQENLVAKYIEVFFISSWMNTLR